jgi:hypothetical protein
MFMARGTNGTYRSNEGDCIMQNESCSLMHAATSSAESKSDLRPISTDHLQSLQQDNARLRTIVAELLLKNQALRWQLADPRSPQMPLALQQQPDREA